MVIPVQLSDGTGGKQKVKVLENQSLLVGATTPPLPEAGSASEFRFFSSNFGSEGADAGVVNLNVDGSVTPQIFFIRSVETNDIRINKLMLYIQDTQVTHSGFGNLAALANGVDVISVESGNEVFVINKAKTFADLIQQTFAQSPWGDDLTSFELTNVDGTQDAQVLPMDIGSLVPDGIRIGRGTQDMLKVVVNDDLTGLTVFTVRGAGFSHFPPAKR